MSDQQKKIALSNVYGRIAAAADLKPEIESVHRGKVYADLSHGDAYGRFTPDHVDLFEYQGHSNQLQPYTTEWSYSLNPDAAGERIPNAKQRRKNRARNKAARKARRINR